MEWRDVKGYDGLYQVSDDGQVRSMDRVCTGKRNRAIKGKVLKQTKTSTGYLKVELCKDGRKISTKVHRIVAMAFIENPDGKPNINHIDNNPLNNNVKNLEWCTQKENMIHARKIGAIKKKIMPRIATDEVIDSILEEHIPYDREHSIRAICRRKGISDATVYTAIQRRSYL